MSKKNCTLSIVLGILGTIVISGATSAVMTTQVIKHNPETIIASLENYQKEQMEAEQSKASEVLKDKMDEIANDPTDAFIGPKDSKKVIVEFFDYNCGYCKKSYTEILRISKENPDVKVVLKEFPIFGPSSEVLSRAALAVNKHAPEKYFAFHGKLMEHKGEMSVQALQQLAGEVGITNIDFSKELEKTEYADKIKRDQQLAVSMGLRGTPAFVINGKLIPGAIEYSQIISLLEEKK